MSKRTVRTKRVSKKSWKRPTVTKVKKILGKVPDRTNTWWSAQVKGNTGSYSVLVSPDPTTQYPNRWLTLLCTQGRKGFKTGWVRLMNERTVKDTAREAARVAIIGVEFGNITGSR